MSKGTEVDKRLGISLTEYGDKMVKDLNLKKERPSIFIGSSSESHFLAVEIKNLFSSHFNVDPWKMSVFTKTNPEGRNVSIAEQLKNFTDIYDFALFLFVPDEEVIAETRTIIGSNKMAKAMATKHNVIFEFGLFLGRLGAKNSVILYHEDVQDFIDLFFTDLKDTVGKNSSDLGSHFNINILKFSGDYSSYLKGGDNSKLLESIRKDLRIKIKELEKKFKSIKNEINFGFLPSTSLAHNYYNNFIERLIKTMSALWLEKEYSDPFEKPEDITDLISKSKNVVFYIIIPDDIIQTRYETFKEYVQKDGKLISVNIKTNLGRPCSVYVRTDFKKSLKAIEIYDFPTVLNSSIDAIEFTSQETDIKELLSEKEKRNFKKVMMNLLKTNGGKVESEVNKFKVEFIQYGNFVQKINDK